MSGVAQDAQCAGNFQTALNRKRTSGRFIEQHHVGAELPGQLQRGAFAGVKPSQCLVRRFRVGMNLQPVGRSLCPTANRRRRVRMAKFLQNFCVM